METLESMRGNLKQVYWIGGSPCSGKSSIAEALVQARGFLYYSCDEAFFRHAEEINPHDQPVFSKIIRLKDDDLWMRPVQQQVDEEIAVYREEFPLILRDLLQLAEKGTVLAEGAALMPALVAPLLLLARRAIWVVPSADFQRYHYSRRGWAQDVVGGCSDPAQAFQRWMERDIRFAYWIQREAQEQGLHTLVVDGSTSIIENTALVANYFQLEGSVDSL